jgi:hypothetical protein
LEPGTLYVVSHGQHTALDFLLNDKGACAQWLREESQPEGIVARAETSAGLFVPPVEGTWPNLVVKLAGEDGAQYVLMARVRDEAEARAALQLDASGWPLAFRNAGLWARWGSRLFGRGDVLFQRFVPPEVDARGHAQIVRMHLLITPRIDVFLSAHRVVAAAPPPVTVPYGVIRDTRPFVVNFSIGATYAPIETDMERELEKCAHELGAMMRRAISSRFVIHP